MASDGIFTPLTTHPVGRRARSKGCLCKVFSPECYGRALEMFLVRSISATTPSAVQCFPLTDCPVRQAGRQAGRATICLFEEGSLGTVPAHTGKSLPAPDSVRENNINNSNSIITLAERKGIMYGNETRSPNLHNFEV